MLTKLTFTLLPTMLCCSSIVCASDFVNMTSDIPSDKSPLSTKNTKELSFLKNSAAFHAVYNDQTIFKAEYKEKADNWRHNSYGGGINNLSSWGINLDMPLQGDYLKLQGQINSGQFDNRRGYLQANRNYLHPTELQGDTFNGLINLGLTGKINGYNYGFEYHSLSDNYTNFIKKNDTLKKDRAGFTYKLGKSINDFNFDIAYLNSWDNISLNPAEMQYTENTVKVSSTYTISSWPYSAVTLAYNYGDRKSSYVPQQQKTYDGTINGVSASFNMSYDSIDISLGTSLDFIQNDYISQERSQSMYYYLSASYSPVSSIYITPYIAYSTNILKSAYSNYQYDGLDLSVSLSYIPVKLPFSLSYYISHNSYKGNDSYTNNSAIYNTLSLEWVVRKINNKKQSILRLDVEHSNYTDNIYTTSSLSDVFIGLSWVYALR